MIDGFLALYIFMLAAFTGKEIIGRVPVILHTPLMSGSNFVHGIVLVGAMIALAHAESPLAIAIGFVGVVLGVLVLDEKIGWNVALGGLLVLVSAIRVRPKRLVKTFTKA